jgi:fructan beta-fructosidase
MYNFKRAIFIFAFFQFLVIVLFAQDKKEATITAAQSEILYRPYIHFTPAKGWMNDPNGMFYKDGVYHLYFQHYPDSTVWGPMHWGHATSTDLMHWKEQPIAIYPDSIGLIFSGSAVVDEHNTSGFGENGKAPIVAIFTQHNMQGEKNGSIDFQTQSIAYSNDNGYTWKKYAGNPVIKNPGIKDFRDPKVIWYEPSKKWIMVLAIKNKVSFYSSSNLKDWTKESDFGMGLGSHDGVWECPDLFSLKYNGKTYWVLTSSINPGGPNKGSATQYFIGDFDGHTFKSNSTKTKWMDYGADNYAGVTFSNTGGNSNNNGRAISIGWMSNWMYAQQVPTVSWRSATTTARTLYIAEEKGEA